MNLRVKEPLGYRNGSLVVTSHHAGQVAPVVTEAKGDALVAAGVAEWTSDAPTAPAITDDKEPIATFQQDE